MRLGRRWAGGNQPFRRTGSRGTGRPAPSARPAAPTLCLVRSPTPDHRMRSDTRTPGEARLPPILRPRVEVVDPRNGSLDRPRVGNGSREPESPAPPPNSTGTSDGCRSVTPSGFSPRRHFTPTLAIPTAKRYRAERSGRNNRTDQRHDAAFTETIGERTAYEYDSHIHIYFCVMGLYFFITQLNCPSDRYDDFKMILYIGRQFMRIDGHGPAATELVSTRSTVALEGPSEWLGGATTSESEVDPIWVES